MNYSTIIFQCNFNFVKISILILFIISTHFSKTSAQNSKIAPENKTIYSLKNSHLLNQIESNPITILYIQKPAPSYSKKQNKWLVKNGFLLVDYKWDNLEINLNIKGAMINRGISKFSFRIACFYLLRGLFIDIVHNMVDSDKERFNGHNSYLAAGGLTRIGILLYLVS